jgi:hypothetical protein
VSVVGGARARELLLRLCRAGPAVRRERLRRGGSPTRREAIATRDALLGDPSKVALRESSYRCVSADALAFNALCNVVSQRAPQSGASASSATATLPFTVIRQPSGRPGAGG